MYQHYSGTTVNGTPAVHDFNSDEGVNAEYAWIKNTDGANPLTVALSQNGTDYGDEIALAAGEEIIVSVGRGMRNKISIDKVRFTYDTAAATYKAFLY